MSGKHKSKYKRMTVPLDSKHSLTLYVGQHTRNAVRDVFDDLHMYKEVKVIQVMEAYYEQGKKDGRKEMVETMDAMMDSVKSNVNYLGPGRPKKATRKVRVIEARAKRIG